MYGLTIHGYEVVVRSRRWFGPFNFVMHEVYACEPDGSRIYLAVFNTVAEAWKYIANAGHRVQNPAELLLAAIVEHTQFRDMDELYKNLTSSSHKRQEI